MRDRALITVVLLAAALLAGCGGGTGAVVKSAGVVVAPAAVAQGARALRAPIRAVEVSADDIRRLSVEAAVPEEVVRTVAPQLDQQPAWQRSVGSAGEAYSQVPNELQEAVTSVACQVASGQITTRDEFYAAVADQFDVASMTRSEFEAAMQDIQDLYEDLLEARRSPDPDQRVSAVLFCFTVEQLQGPA